MKRPLSTLFITAFLWFGPLTLSADPAPAEDPGLTLSFQNADIDAVLSFFSQVTGVIFIKSEAVRGNVSISAPGQVTKTEALQILKTVLELRGFALVPGPGRLTRVLTLAEAVQTSLEVTDGSAPGDDRMVTQVLPLKFLSVTDIRSDLSTLLSRGGNLIADARSNSFVVTDFSSNIRRLAKVTAALDVRSPQVLIEALMVEVSLTSETKLGFEWSHNGGFSAKGHQFSGEASAAFNLGSFITEGLKYSVIRSDGELRGLLQMLATDNNVNILSTPHVMAANNQTALIRVGEEIPVLTQTRNIQGGETIRSFDFKQVAIELEVTPRISPDRDVYLKVHPLVKKILGYNAELNAPILATREAQTAVQVKDGETIVIGGLMKDDRTVSNSKIPILGDIPVLGWFFRKHGNTREKTELLVFITPRVILSTEEGRSVTQAKEAETKSPVTPNRTRAGALYRVAKRLEREKKYPEALVAYERASEAAPDERMRTRCAKRAAKVRRKLN